jgi:hypothetical protein
MSSPDGNRARVTNQETGGCGGNDCRGAAADKAVTREAHRIRPRRLDAGTTGYKGAAGKAKDAAIDVRGISGTIMWSGAVIKNRRPELTAGGTTGAG